MDLVNHFHERSDCRFCGASTLWEYLDLGEQPPSNSFLVPSEVEAEVRYPLKVSLCESCGLSQLRGIVSAKAIFSEYQYLSSTSRALVEHYQQMTATLSQRYGLQAQDAVVDIGCNDGIMLKAYPAGLGKRVGVEPSSAGRLAEAAGLTVYPSFFNRAVAESIRREHGRAKIVTATNVFAHIDDIHEVVEGVRTLIEPDGLFVIETPYVLDTIDQCLFDTIYHEHLCYLGLTPLQRLFASHELQIVDVERVAVGASGPAIRVISQRVGGPQAPQPAVAAMLADEAQWGILSRERYRAFADRIASVKVELKRLLLQIQAEGGHIGGYGAPAKGNTLLNTFEIGPELLTDGIAETNTIKHGKLTPGSHIPILSEEEFLARKPSHALLLTWNYLEFFLRKSPYIQQGGQFVVPLPHPRVVSAKVDSSV